MATRLPAAILGALLLSGTSLINGQGSAAHPSASGEPYRTAAAHLTAPIHHHYTAVTKTASMTTVAQDWRTVPPLDAVDLVSATTGFVAGASAIYRTTSAGRHWERQYAGPDEIVGMDMVTPNAGWAWSPTHLLRDVAGHWGPVPEPAIGPLHVVDFLNTEIGYGVAGPLTEPAFQDGLAHQTLGDVVVTHDGGLHWSTVRTPFGQAGALLFVSPTRGLAIAHRQLWATTNGGRTWERGAKLPIAGGLPWSYQWSRGPHDVVWILARGANAGLGNRAYTVLQTHLNGGTVQQVFNEGYMYPGDYPELSPTQSVYFGESAGWLAASPSVSQVAFAGWRWPHLRITLTSASAPHNFVHLVLAGPSRNWPFFETATALAVMPGLMLLVGQGPHHGRLLLSTNLGRTWSAVVP